MHRRLHTHTHVRDNHNAPTQTEREGTRGGERDGDSWRNGGNVCAHIMLPAERRHRLALIGGHAPGRAKDTDGQDLYPCNPGIQEPATAVVFVRGRRLYCFKCHAFIVCPLSPRLDRIRKYYKNGRSLGLKREIPYPTHEKPFLSEDFIPF